MNNSILSPVTKLVQTKKRHHLCMISHHPLPPFKLTKNAYIGKLCVGDVFNCLTLLFCTHAAPLCHEVSLHVKWLEKCITLTMD